MKTGLSTRTGISFSKSPGIKLNFDAQTGGFTSGNTITGATSGATAVVLEEIGGETLTLTDITGTFQDDEIIYESALGSELVLNGGFDSDTANWTAANSALLTSVAGGKSGNCLQVTENGANSPYAYQDITVTTGNFYKFQSYVKAGTEATYHILVRDKTNSAVLYDSTYSEETAGDWSTIAEAEVVAPSGCVEMTIRLFQIASSGAATTILFDSITLKQITNAALANGTVY